MMEKIDSKFAFGLGVVQKEGTLQNTTCLRQGKKMLKGRGSPDEQNATPGPLLADSAFPYID